MIATILGRKISHLGAHLLLFISAVALAFILVSASAGINDAHYQRWPLKGDTASYWIRDMRIAERAETVGFRKAAVQEAMENARDPLRMLSYAVTGPKGVLSKNGHLYFLAFTALLFFWTLGLCLLERSRSLTYALAVPVTALFTVGTFHPLYGAPSRLPDYPASMLLGAALFSVFLSRNGHRQRWLLAAGVLLGLAALSRYHASVYGLFVLTPIVALYALGRHLEAGHHPATLLRPRHLLGFARVHLPFLAGVVLTAGFFLAWWAREVFSFYAKAGYSLNHTIEVAFATTGSRLVISYFGVPALTAFGLLMAGYIIACRSMARKNDWLDHAAITWAAGACILLILVIMRVEDDITQTYYMGPGLMLLALAPFAVQPRDRAGNLDGDPLRAGAGLRPITTLAVMAGVVLYASFTASYFVLIKSEQFLYPRPRDQEIHRFNSELGDLMSKAISGARPVQGVPQIDTNFDYYARFMVPDILRRTGKITRFANVFQIRQSQWELQGAGEESIARARIMRNLAAKVDVFAALEEFSSPAAMEVLKDEYTARLAQFVAAEMAANPGCWKNLGRIVSPYGPVTVYDNVARRGAPGCTASSS